MSGWLFLSTFLLALFLALAKRRGSSLLGSPLHLPTNTRLDRRLILGSLAFGIGWGMAGLCPGPAMVSMAAGQGKALLFVLAMLAGMLAPRSPPPLCHWVSRLRLKVFFKSHDSPPRPFFDPPYCASRLA